jgi:N-acetylglutamate synthase-like GNAT family acetyltransferase
VLAKPKKIRRRHPPGELTVEQSQDAALIAPILDRAGIVALAGFAESGDCFLLAYLGDDPVGIVGLKTEVDAALMRPLFVLETMRRRGVGASLVRAVRLAARTRGARTLYATTPTESVDYFARLGFADTGFGELAKAFGQLSVLQRTGSDELPECRAVCLDISRDGVIER